MHGAMNMQMSPTSTHSLPQRSTGWRSHVDLIDYKVVCDVRNTSDFKPCFWNCLWFTIQFLGGNTLGLLFVILVLKISWMFTASCRLLPWTLTLLQYCIKLLIKSLFFNFYFFALMAWSVLMGWESDEDWMLILFLVVIVRIDR